MRISRPMRTLSCLLALLTQTAKATELSEAQINENTIAIVQAFLNLPDDLIGGVSLEDRREFLSQVSHYGDIDFARGYFRLRGDGARAYDEPSSRWFELKILPRENGRPICVIVQWQGSAKPISVISFGQFWRWTDVTSEYLPETLELDPSWSFRLSPETNEVMVISHSDPTWTPAGYPGGVMKGRLVSGEGRFSWVEFNYSRFFREAIHQLPPRYFADIPYEQRDLFIEAIENDAERFDPERGWLHWFSDGRDIAATSMLWVKTLPRPNGEPYLFIHMAKPFAGLQPPGSNQTYLMYRDGEDWRKDRTILNPDQLNLTHHFRPRKDGVIESGPWKEIDRKDGKGKAWAFGERQSDLHWNARYDYRATLRPSESEVTTFSESPSTGD